MTETRYLDYAAVAERLGIKVATARSYKQMGRLPAPDIWIGASPAWREDTIERVAANLAPNARVHRQAKP